MSNELKFGNESLVSHSNQNSSRLQNDLFTMLKHMATQLKADVATLFLYDAISEQFFLPVGYGLLDTNTFSNPRMRPRIERVAGSIVRNREPVIADRVIENQIMDGPFARREQIKSAAGHPILSTTGEPIGVLFVSFRHQVHAFSSADIKIIKDTTLQIAQVVSQENLSELRISDSVEFPSKLDKSLQAISNIACNGLNLPVAIWVLANDRAHLRIHSYTGLNNTYVDNAITYLGDESLIDQVMRTGETITILDVLNDKRFRYQEQARMAGWSSALAYPVRSNRQVGVIEVFSFTLNKFDKGERDTLKHLAELVSVTIESNRYLIETEALADITRILSATPDFGRAMQVIVEKACKLTSADTGTIFLLDNQTNRFLIGARTPIQENPPKELPRTEGGITRRILDKDEPIHIPDVLVEDQVRELVKKEGTSSLIGVPLRVANEQTGVLYVSSQRPGHFDENDISLLQTLSNQASVALGWAHRLLILSGEIEQAISELFRMDEILSEVCDFIQINLGFDFVAVQLIRPEEDIIETVYGSGVAASWSGRSKHFLESQEDLRDIQADIAISGQVEIIAGNDPRFDKWLYEEFQHEHLYRVFVPLFILRNDRGEVIEGCFQYLRWQVEQQPGDTQRTVIGVSKVDHQELGETTLEVIGTIEAGYKDRKKPISVEQAVKLLEIASQKAMEIRKAQLPYVLETLVHHAMRIMQADSATLHYHYHQQSKQYIYEVCSGRISTRFLHQHKPRRSGLGRQAIKAGKYMYIPDPINNQGDLALENLNPKVFKEGIQAMAAFPLVVEGKEGVLYTHFHNRHRFTKDELDWVELFVKRAAYAIRHATLYIQAKERARQLATLHSVALLLSSSTEGTELLRHCAWNTLNILGADVVTLYEYVEAEQSFLTPPYMAGRLREEKAMTTEIHPHDAPSLLVQSKRNVYVAESDQNQILNNANRPRVTNRVSFVEREMIYSSAGVVLRVREEIVGVMFINYRREHHFSTEEKQIIETLASSAALAIKSRRLVESMTDIDREIITTLDLNKLLKIIVEKAVRVTDAEVGDIRLYDKLNDQLVLQARVPEGEPINQSLRRLRVGEGVTGWVAKNKRAVLINDVRKDKRYKAFFRGALSELCVPLLDKDGHLLGILNLESRTSRHFSKKDLHAVQALANQAVIAIQNAERQRRLVANETIATLGDLASSLIHKINNDLSVIKTEAESLRDSIITDKESLDQIERIRKVNLNILKEVENLRKWILKSPHPVNLNTAIIQAVNEANKRGGVKSKVKLDTSGFPADLPETLGSQLLLTEVFAELIQNADKAIDKKGWIKISGKTLILDGKQMNLVLIEDNGRGIPEDDLEKIFDRGYSTGSSTKKGLGFGLWWIRSYIERLGGFVSVESQFGKGSLFKVVLPCSEVN